MGLHYFKSVMETQIAEGCPDLAIRRRSAGFLSVYPLTIDGIMLSIDPAGIAEFMKETAPMREAILGLVDARPNGYPPPAADSPAMADLAAQQDFVDDWDAEPMINIRVCADLQILAACEGAALIAESFGSPRSYLLSPYVMLRMVAESAGRVAWLLDPSTSRIVRVVRGLNLRSEDFYYRKRIVDGDMKSELTRRLRAIRDTAKARGLQVESHGARLIAPGLPSKTEFAKLGLKPAMAPELTHFASAAVHGSVTAILPHVLRKANDRGFAEPNVVELGWSANSANLILCAVGLVLEKCANVGRGYMGWTDPTWDSARAIFRKRAESLIANQSLAGPPSTVQRDRPQE